MVRSQNKQTQKQKKQTIERKFEFISIFSSIKTPLLHHATSVNTEVEGGRMVKEWDFETGKKSK